MKMRFRRFPAMGHEQKSAKTFDSYLLRPWNDIPNEINNALMLQHLKER